MSNFIQTLNDAWQRTNSLLCVGLDPEPSKFPGALANRPEAIFDFCRTIVDATAPYASSFKPQIAYFAAHRAEDQLEQLIAHIHANHPGLPVILDAKRGDIGSTAEQYAREAFERYQADAVTVNPYMGFDSIEPYLEHQGKGVIVLCRTSNVGGSDLQFLETGGRPLYQVVAQLAAQKWNASGQLALVVGATFPKEIEMVRGIVTVEPAAPNFVATQIVLAVLAAGVPEVDEMVERAMVHWRNMESGYSVRESMRSLLLAAMRGE